MAATRPPTGGGGGGGAGIPLAAKIGIGVFSAIGLIVAYFVVFFSEVDSQITAETKREENLRTELSKAEESNKAYQADLEEKTRRERLALDQKKVLPDEAETPAFLSAIQGVATVAGVNLNSFTPKDEVNDKFYARVPMELTVSGRFHQIARFFYGVGRLDRIINIEDIDMSLSKAAGKADSDTEEVVLNVKCLATAFRATSQNAAAATSRKRGQ